MRGVIMSHAWISTHTRRLHDGETIQGGDYMLRYSGKWIPLVQHEFPVGLVYEHKKYRTVRRAR